MNYQILIVSSIAVKSGDQVVYCTLQVGFLERENSRLTDLYTQEWRRLQEEDISLPTDMEELHHLLLRYREDVIRSRVAKEHGEDGLKSELLFLRDQLLAEQQNKDDFVQMLHKETGTLPCADCSCR